MSTSKLASVLLTGTAVTLVVTAAGVSDSFFTSTFGVPTVQGSLDVTFETASVVVAPAKVRVKTSNYSGLGTSFVGSGSAYLGERVEYLIMHTVRNSPLSQWTVPDIHASQNNPNVMFGDVSDFVFPDPGTYHIDTWALGINGAEADIISTEAIIVGDPDVVYAGSLTHVVALDGVFTGAPSGATQHSTTTSLLSALGSSTNGHRILFKRGEEYPELQLRMFNGGTEFDYIGSWGDAADPVPVLADGSIEQHGSRVNGLDLTVTDIELRGGWDPATETGHVVYNDALSFNTFLPKAGWFTFHNVKISGYRTGAVFGRGNGGDSTFNEANVTLHHCSIDGWANYGLFGRGPDELDISVIGCRIHQLLDAMSGGGDGSSFKAWGFKNAHGPSRIAEALGSRAVGCSFFSRGGWSSDGAGATADQEPQRLFTSDVSTGLQLGHIDRCVFQGGSGAINMKLGNEGAGSPVSVIVERSIFVGTSRSVEKKVFTYRTGLMIRNCLFFDPDVLMYRYQTNSQDIIGVRAGGAEGVGLDGNVSNRVDFIYNTIYSPRTAANDGRTYEMAYLDPAMTNVNIEHNVHHRPNAATVLDAGPVAVSNMSGGLVTLDLGPRYGFKPWETRSFAATVLDGATFFVPYSEILQELDDGSTQNNNAATTQAYWQAREAAGDTRHLIYVGSATTSVKHFSTTNSTMGVSFDPTGVTVTNLSGGDWGAGGKVALQLDRNGLVPAIQSAHASDGIPIPQVIPQVGSAAYRSVTSGATFPTDFFAADQSLPATAGAFVA